MCGLLLGAGVKNRMLKAGLNGTTIFPWNRQRQEDVRWWEVCGIMSNAEVFRLKHFLSLFDTAALDPAFSRWESYSWTGAIWP